jgi:hypothetical protein
MLHPKDLLKKLIHIEDKPERTALAFSIGVFIGFSPFLGLHTLASVIVAFLFGMNRVAVLLGAWTNTPWWLIPYYTFATWLGMRVMKFHMDETFFQKVFRSGTEEGFLRLDFWKELASQWPILLSFGIGSLILASILAMVSYPLALRGIRFYRQKRGRQ